jgi:hypothetical protein
MEDSPGQHTYRTVFEAEFNDLWPGTLNIQNSWSLLKGLGFR